MNRYYLYSRHHENAPSEWVVRCIADGRELKFNSQDEADRICRELNKAYLDGTRKQ